jgi:hypothetical protein
MLNSIGYGLAQGPFTTSAFPRPFCTTYRPRGVALYDSIAEQFKAEAIETGSFNDQTKLYFDPLTSAGFQKMAYSGCSLLRSVEEASGGNIYFIDDSSGSDPAGWTRSDTYNTQFSALTSAPNTYDYAMILTGTNDANQLGGNSKDKHKQALRKLKEFIRADFPKIQCAFLHVLHRSDSGDSSPAIYQAVREAQHEILAEDKWFRRLPDCYDLDQQDQSHFTETEYQTRIPARYVKAIAYHFRKAPLTGVYGPEVTGVDFYGDHAKLTVAQDGGTDFAAIPSGAENTLGFVIGSTVYTPSSVERVNATTLRAHFENKGLADGTPGQAKIAYGTMAALSQTAPEVIKDNATDARPLRSKVVTMTSRDPLWAMHDLALDLCPKTALKTYVTGALVSGAVDRFGKTWACASGDEATYDATLFGGRGGLKAADGTRLMQSPNASWTASSTGFGGIVFELPASVPNTKFILTFEQSTQVSFYMDNTGRLHFQQNEATGDTVISGTADLRSKKNVLIWNFRSTSAADFYLNGNPVFTLDPRDSLSTWDRITLFNRTPSETGGIVDLRIGRLFHRGSAHNPSTDPAIADIISFLRAHYGTE